MKIGDLVRLRYNYNNSSIGVIVDDIVLENAKEIDRVYKVLWQSGNCDHRSRVVLEVINADR